MKNSHGIMILLVASLAGCMDGAQDDLAAQKPQEAPVGSTSVATPSDEHPTVEAGTILGHVTDNELRPISAATVRIQALDAQLTVAEDGRFEFLDVPAGRHVLQANAPGYDSHAVAVHVEAGQQVDIDIVLAPLAPAEPRVEVLEQTLLINYSAGAATLLAGTVSQMCNDRCMWYAVLPGIPDHFLIEVFGEHSMANPRGWDGLGSTIRGYPLNGSSWNEIHSCDDNYPTDWNNECLRLPLWIPFEGSILTAQNNPEDGALERLRIHLSCEQSWFCVDERYDVALSLFYDWEGEEVPPDYSTRPGG